MSEIMRRFQRGPIPKAAFLAAFLLLIIYTIPASAEPFSLRIVHVNDTHSHLEPTRITVNLGDKSTYVYAGGYPRLAAMVKEARSGAPSDVLVLHAGDAVQGTLYFTLYKGRAGLALLDLMDFDAMVPGNHEFDKGPDFLAQLIQEADFPIVAANVDASKDPDLNKLIKPYIIKELGGQKVGIIGLITADTPDISSPGDKLVFSDVAATARRMVEELEAGGVNKIIVLSHIGYEKDMALAKSVPGLDVIVGGHSHTLLGDFSSLGMASQGDYPTVVTGPMGEKVYIVQSWEWAKAVGLLDVVFDEKGVVEKCDGRAVLTIGDAFLRKNDEGERVEVDPEIKKAIIEEIEANPAVRVFQEDGQAAAKLAEYQKGMEALKNTVVAKVAEDLLHIRAPGVHAPTGVNLASGSQIAPLAAESMLWITKRTGLNTDLALLNAGGVRTDVQHGDLTVAEVYELLPFGNTLVVMELTGEEIKQALEHGATKGGGAFPYLAGARYTVETARPEGQRVTNVEVRTASGDWKPLSLSDTYRMVTLSYLAGGGDAYKTLKNAPGERYETGFVDAEVFMEFAEKQGVLKPLPETGVTYIR